MQGLSLVPEPMWWLLTAIVGFYFGARHQTKGQEFRREIAAVVAAAPAVRTVAPVERNAGENPALSDWRESTER